MSKLYLPIPKGEGERVRMGISEEEARSSAQAWAKLKNEPCYVVEIITTYVPRLEVSEEP